MSDAKLGPRWPGTKDEPREIGPCDAAPGPDEDELEAVSFDDTVQKGAFSSASATSESVLPKVNGLGAEPATVDVLEAGIATKAAAGPSRDLKYSDQGPVNDSAGSCNPQTGRGEWCFVDGALKWDDVVQEYVRDAVGEGFLVGDAVVHDSGWWERDGRRLRLVLVEGKDQPQQRSWVLNLLLPGLGSR